MQSTKTPTYILSLDASQFVYDVDQKVYALQLPEIKTLYQFNKYYTGSIVDSLDIMNLESLCKNINEKLYKTKILNNRTKMKVEKQYSDLIVDISFDQPKRVIKDKESYSLKKKSIGYELLQKKYSIGKVDVKQQKLRNEFYLHGFIIHFLNEKNQIYNTVHFVEYKRSSSKAKNGDCLFIKENLKEPMIEWSHLDLPDPKGEIDLASLKAYEALVCSGLDVKEQNTIKLEPKNILLIDDLMSPQFEAYQSVTSLKDVTKTYVNKNGKAIQKKKKEIDCNNQWINVQNTCSDGECLLDESLFPIYDVIKDESIQHGFMLLRQRFFKSAALNTKIVEFYKQYYGNQYDTAITHDKFGRDVKVSDIRMIVCPSSLKILKLYRIWFDTEKACYEHWLRHLKDDNFNFGIVKHEKRSPFGYNTNQLSYQIINSLPLNKDEVKKLLNFEFDYISSLKNDINIFIKHINADRNNKEDDKSEEIKTSRDFINTMIKICPDFYKTQLFKDFRHDTIENYRKIMRKGKIKTQCDYAVQFGNVYELLLSTVKEINTNDVVFKGRQCYCPRFIDNEGLAVFRSPHISTGNVLYAENKYCEKFKWFNLTDNIVLINAWDNDWFDRTQGSDCDSDSLILASNFLLAEKAKECDVIPQKGNEYLCLYPTPKNNIEGKKTYRKYTPQNMANIDHIICNNNIGKVVNMSQLLNSYYWDIKLNHPEYKGLLDDIYKSCSICSSLSQIEIDKSKKMFENLAVKRILNSMQKIKDINDKPLMQMSNRHVNKTYFTEEEAKTIISMQQEVGILKESTSKNDIKHIKINNSVIKELPDRIKYREYQLSDGTKVDYIRKLIKPDFFRYCSTDHNIDSKFFDTPMDYLEQILNEEFPKVTKDNRIKAIDIMELISGKGKINDGQLKTIYQLVTNARSALSSVYAEYGDTSSNAEKQQDKENRLMNIREETVLDLQKMKIRSSMIFFIFGKIYGTCGKNDEWHNKLKKIALTLIGMLYQAQPELMQNAFKKKKKLKISKKMGKRFYKKAIKPMNTLLAS